MEHFMTLNARFLPCADQRVTLRIPELLDIVVVAVHADHSQVIARDDHGHFLILHQVGDCWMLGRRMVIIETPLAAPQPVVAAIAFIEPWESGELERRS